MSSDPHTIARTFEAAELAAFTVGKASLALSFHRKCNEGTVSFDASTMADICCSERDIYNELETDNITTPKILETLHSCLGEQVKHADTVADKRAIELRFPSRSLFIWARPDALPGELFVVKETHPEPAAWWTIDA